MIVPTLRVGMQPRTLRVPKSVTQSVTRGIPTQSVGTIDLFVGAALGFSYRIGVSVCIIGFRALVVPARKLSIELSRRFALAFDFRR